jgi:hypothetical protein
MRFAVLCMAVMLGLAAPRPAAAEAACGAIAGLRAEELTGCTCGKALAQLPLSAPPGMRLVAACGQQDEHGDWTGRFLFVGSHVESGTVTREEDEFFGDMLRFTAEKSLPFEQFANASAELKFWDDADANRRFRAPRPTLAISCRSAQARLEIQVLEVISGGGDQDGSYPRKYRVLNIGKYRPCK